ncbi:dihydrodipicolinate synthase family protein [Kineococcus terrestris]|uniref:dihydrodipicolinate synthase family protein n=1 Tax=Kineococcus terrestris TaxID=2044856 RepID=UPI0034DB0868
MTAVQSAPAAWPRPSAPLRSRVVYAAAHVVPVVGSDTTPGGRVDVDWDATLGYRRDIWSYGLGVADAMDTAQRGMGLDWPAAAELIRRSSAEARAVGGAIACGAGTDQLDLATLPGGERGLEAVLAAYREQLEVVTGAGATVILMASRALARVARSAEDYLRVYGTLLDECPSPVVLHWLGPMFDPALTGYWGSTDVPTATATLLQLIEQNAAKVDGVKVSLLDADHEEDLRARLPEGVRLYTGDDYNYPDLIVGDGTRHSDALLGIFAAIYPVASAAVQALDAGDDRRAHELLASTQDLARHVFEPPTFHYKTGIAFLSWLNGRQPGFSLVGGLHAGRSVPHLVTLHRLAAEAGLLVDPDLAEHRLSAYLLTQGVGA